MHTAESQNATKGTTKLTRDKNEHETQTKPAFVSTDDGTHRHTDPRPDVKFCLSFPRRRLRSRTPGMTQTESSARETSRPNNLYV